LRSKGDRRALARYEAGLSKDREIIRLLLGTRQKLERLYADTSRDPEAMRREKAAILKDMRGEYAQWHGDSRYDRAFNGPWNNARLNSVATYFDLVPGFEHLLKREHGDLKSFHAAVGKMRHLSKDKRRARLRGD
ncbi:MAG: aminopeptidase, partial [Chthoniobacteraceae bacterium]